MRRDYTTGLKGLKEAEGALTRFRNFSLGREIPLPYITVATLYGLQIVTEPRTSVSGHSNRPFPTTIKHPA